VREGDPPDTLRMNDSMLEPSRTRHYWAVSPITAAPSPSPEPDGAP